LEINIGQVSMVSKLNSRQACSPTFHL